MSKKKPKRIKENIDQNSEAASEPAAEKAPSNWHIWKILTLVFFVLSVVMGLYAYDRQYDYSISEENLGLCFIELENTELALKDLEVTVERLEKTAEVHGMGDASVNPLTKDQIKEFEEKGLRMPANNILNDLYSRSDIIPYNEPGNFGFRFTDRRLLYLLSHNRAFANFASRDEKGWMFLSYKVHSKDSIVWKVIDSYCPECNN